jgi:hypothetical protein
MKPDLAQDPHVVGGLDKPKLTDSEMISGKRRNRRVDCLRTCVAEEESINMREAALSGQVLG